MQILPFILTQLPQFVFNLTNPTSSSSTPITTSVGTAATGAAANIPPEMQTGRYTLPALPYAYDVCPPPRLFPPSRPLDTNIRGKYIGARALHLHHNHDTPPHQAPPSLRHQPQRRTLPRGRRRDKPDCAAGADPFQRRRAHQPLAVLEEPCAGGNGRGEGRGGAEAGAGD